MPESFTVYPAYLGKFKAFQAELFWLCQRLKPRLVMGTDEAQCQAYLVMGSDREPISEMFGQSLDRPDHPVVWFDDDGQMKIYTCMTCFVIDIPATPWFVDRLLTPPPPTTILAGEIAALQTGDGREEILEVVIDIDPDGMFNCRVPAGVRVRVVDRSLEEPATFLYTADGAVDRQPLSEPYVPEVDEWVTVYPQDGHLPFVARVVKVADNLITVLDRNNDAWEVEPSEIEPTESEFEADDDEGGDLCDNCRRSGVSISQTCACGNTLCADCAEDDDGRCSVCAAEDDEEDDEEDGE